jgi:hypothetical protein
MGCSLCSDSLPPHLHLRELLAHPYVAATRELSQPSNAVIASVIPITASPPLGEAVAEFLARRDLDDHTRRSYGQTMTRLRRELGDAAVLADVNPGDVASVFAAWDDAAARTWNRHRSAVRSFAAWAAGPSRAWVTADLAALLERRPETRNRTRAIARHEVDALLSRGDVPLREKTLWRLLYESAARADSVLSLDIEDLDKFLSVGADRCWRGSAAAWSPPVSWTLTGGDSQARRFGDSGPGRPSTSFASRSGSSAGPSSPRATAAWARAVATTA